MKIDKKKHIQRYNYKKLCVIYTLINDIKTYLLLIMNSQS